MTTSSYVCHCFEQGFLQILERDGYMCGYHDHEVEYYRAQQIFVETGVRHRGVPMAVVHILPFAPPAPAKASEDSENAQVSQEHSDEATQVRWPPRRRCICPGCSNRH